MKVDLKEAIERCKKAGLIVDLADIPFENWPREYQKAVENIASDLADNLAERTFETILKNHQVKDES